MKHRIVRLSTGDITKFYHKRSKEDDYPPMYVEERNRYFFEFYLNHISDRGWEVVNCYPSRDECKSINGWECVLKSEKSKFNPDIGR